MVMQFQGVTGSVLNVSLTKVRGKAGVQKGSAIHFSTPLPLMTMHSVTNYA